MNDAYMALLRVMNGGELSCYIFKITPEIFESIAKQGIQLKK